MGSTIIATQQREFQNVALTGLSSSYATGGGIDSASTTKPSVGVVYDSSSNNEMTSLIKFIPYADSNAPGASTIRFHGWNGYVNANGTTSWVPVLIGSYTLVVSDTTVQSVVINGTTRYLYRRINLSAAATSGLPAASVNLYGQFTANNVSTQSCAGVLDVIGSQIVTVQMTIASGTEGGILWSAI